MTGPDPLSALLGSGPPACKVLAEDISVHWYPTDATPGTSCLCGKTQMRQPEVDSTGPLCLTGSAEGTCYLPHGHLGDCERP